ncbi:MAG: hypothetical protein IPP07_10290 [Holophagales bacterium]|nr:hypothetical protein [Holophagales bacterium]MBK9965253.1 hypothetical protein [Holophagales bacterium]
MTCPLFDHLDDEALSAHLQECPACASTARSDARVADSLVAAASAARRYRGARRRAVSGLLAASLVTVALLAVQLARRPAPRPVYVLQGDETGVVLTGPGVARRAESLAPRTPRKGDRT